MDFIKSILRRETGHFAALGKQALLLLASYNIRELARPAFEVFINAFLWRHFGGFAAPAIYNLGRFVGLPAGFYLNALFLRRTSSATLYFIGTIAQAVIVAGVIFLSPESLSMLFVAAVIYGIGNGIYWGNRNFLTLASSREENRGYFVSLELASAKIVGILAPAVIGWFIAAGDTFGTYSIDYAYRVLAGVAFVLQAISGYLVTQLSYPSPEIHRILLRQPDRTWQKMRRFALLAGTFDGVHVFITVFIVLALIGREGELGIVQGLSTLATAMLLYWIGRATKITSQPRVLQSGIWVIIIGAVLLAAFYSSLAAITYIILAALGSALFSQGWSTIFYDAADSKGLQELRYSRILDHEIFLNIGRMAGTLVFLAMLGILGQEFTLRFLPLIIILCQLWTIPLAKAIIKKDSVLPGPVIIPKT